MCDVCVCVMCVCVVCVCVETFGVRMRHQRKAVLNSTCNFVVEGVLARLVSELSGVEG